MLKNINIILLLLFLLLFYRWEYWAWEESLWASNRDRLAVQYSDSLFQRFQDAYIFEGVPEKLLISH